MCGAKLRNIDAGAIKMVLTRAREKIRKNVSKETWENL